MVNKISIFPKRALQHNERLNMSEKRYLYLHRDKAYRRGWPTGENTQNILERKYCKFDWLQRNNI